MATAEPTRADDTGPGIPVPAPQSDDHDRDAAAPPDRTRLRSALDRLAPLRGFLRRHLVLSVTALSGALHLIWFFAFANSGGDLAAQDAWAEFVGRHPDSAYNLAWYGGMHPVSYSVISPYLMSVLGVRTTMMIAGTLSAGLLTLILLRG